jgi:hypothetical protein
LSLHFDSILQRRLHGHLSLHYLCVALPAGIHYHLLVALPQHHPSLSLRHHTKPAWCA